MEKFLLCKGVQLYRGQKIRTVSHCGVQNIFYHRGGTSFPILVFLMRRVSKC